MSKQNTNETEAKSNIDKAGDFAKNVWLAGLGAYGKAFDEAKDVYEKASKETPKLFDDLVKKGEELEAETLDVINETKEKISETKDKVSSRKISDSISSSLEERLNKVRGAFSLGGDSSEKIDSLEAKLDALIKSVDSMKKSINGVAKTVKAMQAEQVAPAAKVEAKKVETKVEA